ncbi:phosphoribosylformylglycinamidine synthase subunit PurQ [bacterium]|jgi:phosphoribosylformylglycinamidine synthase|nr:phosphoribosylformylglycinamidine synthase subunit PurQ [bacterium]
MKFGVVVFPGSNCDHDCYYVLNDVMKVKTDYIWHKQNEISGYDCIVLPGGFSYGDYLRTGAIARFSPVMKSLIEYAEKGGLVIGICNGFQILLESGLLPGAMLKNESLSFVCRDVRLNVENSMIPFTSRCKKGEILEIPVAHGEGNYYADERTIRMLEDGGRVVFRYCGKDGKASKEANPNGSINDIAGICNEKGNVLGMMPHPERCSEKILGSADGTKIFNSIISHLTR